MTLLDIDHLTTAGMPDAGLREIVVEHLGGDPTRMPMLTAQFPFFQDVNVQTALDVWATQPGNSARLYGATVPFNPADVIYRDPTLASLLTSPTTRFSGVSYSRRACGIEQTLLCLERGLVLLDGPEGPVALWVREYGRRPSGGRALDIVAPTIAAAESFLAGFKRLMKQHNRYRGHLLNLVADPFGNVSVEFTPKPVVERDEIILPPGVLEAIEGHAIQIGKRANQLSAVRRHLKRGLLLYGPPGTGKTHTLRYLSSQLPEATLFIMTGSGMAWLDYIKDFAADVTPAIVVLDDVDLIAEDRRLPGMAPREMLFSLLDAMDGMHEDADILFVCTSNRVDTLEQAIAARPGRIDQAVEVGLPDHACRKRLFSLYRTGMDTSFEDLASVLERTEGVTASFIKELLRRAYLGARAAGETTVTDAHLHEALDVLLDPVNPLTPALLGLSEQAILQRQNQRGAGSKWCGI